MVEGEPHREPAAEDPRISRVLEELERRYAGTTPFRQDRDLAPELALEARPAVESLLLAAEAPPEERPRVLDHHEGLAMVTLLGRRAGNLGATPTAVLGLVRSVGEAFEAIGLPLGEALMRDLGAVCLEGFVAGREEHVAERAAERAAEGQLVTRVVEGCVLLTLGGEHAPERLEEVVDAFGRKLLSADAKSGLVDMTRLVAPTPDRAAEVFSAHATARMLGAHCVFVGATEEWLAVARQGRVDTELLLLEPTFEAGLRHALRLAGWELRRSSRLPEPLRSLRRIIRDD